MRADLSTVSRQDLGSVEWDALCAQSEDAWLFHTSSWIPLLKVEDASFAVLDHGGKPLFLVGMGSPRSQTGDELWFSTLRAGVAHLDRPPVELRRELDMFALAEVQRRAISKGAIRIDWELPSMPPGPEALLPALGRSGYECQIFPSRVVDLTLDEDALWRDYRKGCKSVIRRAQRVGVTVQEVTGESGVAVFADLHSRRMRAIGAHSSDPDVFMEIWKSLAPSGECEILLASLPSGAPVSGILLLIHKDLAYYQAACSDPDHMDSGGNTLLVHEALLRAKARGLTSFHMGPSPLASQVSEKAYLVGRFKNQFGGRESAWVMASLELRPSSSPVVSHPVPTRRSSARRVVSAMLPSGVKQRLRTLQAHMPPRPPPEHSERPDVHELFGDFPDWAAALTASMPYQTDLAIYGQITDKIRSGESASGRNLMPILAGIAMASDSGATRILDFGGSLGMVYFEVARILPESLPEWRVVDSEEVVSEGTLNYADGKLAFFASIEAACSDFAPNMVLCSHTLQYLDDPYDALATLSALKPAVIVLHELPLADREQFMIQRLPEALGGTARPVQILSADRLGAALSSYDLIAEIDLPTWDPYIDARHVAQVYRRRG
jgi:putative methyltransferase (TIGR04325 family)